jgi:hypothetical protein
MLNNGICLRDPYEEKTSNKLLPLTKSSDHLIQPKQDISFFNRIVIYEAFCVSVNSAFKKIHYVNGSRVREDTISSFKVKE